MASLVDYILIQKKTLNDIANAIRKKKGSTGLIKAVDMANEISSIQGVSTTQGSCAILQGGTFSYHYGSQKDLKVYCPSCVTYTDNGSELVFTAASVGSGTVTVVSGSTSLLVYAVTVTALESVCNHTSFKTEITTTALCSRTGVKTYTCNTCQTTWTEAIPRLEHSWGDPYASDDFSSGYGRKCEVCGELEELSCPHTNTASKITKYATCYYTGTKSTICNDCGAVVGTETIPKGEHSWTEVYASDDDFSQGWGRKCKVSACGVTQEDVECPHKESTSAITKTATCTDTGTRTYTCKVCKTKTGTETIPKLEHTWSESYASDEFVNGYGRKCLVCGALDGSIACPHTSSTPKVTKAATCTATGTRTYYCDACGTVTKTETIQREPHNYVPVVTAPTCTTEGYTVHTCRVCGNTYTDSYEEATGHNFVAGWQTDEAPTCTSGGTEKRICLTCGHTEYRDVDALGHDLYFDYTVDATCYEGGYDLYRCTRCDYTEHTDETDPNGHNFAGGWVTGVEPTCTAGGTKSRTCMNCGETETYDVDPLGHDYELVSDSSQSSGASMVCTRCGDKYEADYDCDILGHETSDGEYDMPDGSTAFKCKHCGEFY